MEIPWTTASSDIRNEKESQVLFYVRRKDMTSHVRKYFRSTMIIRPKHINSTLQIIPSVLPGLFPRSQIFSENALASLKWKMLGLPCPIQRRTLLGHQKHLRLCLRTGSRDLWQSYSQWTSLGLRVGLGSYETNLHLTLRDLVQWMTLRFAFFFPGKSAALLPGLFLWIPLSTSFIFIGPTPTGSHNSSQASSFLEAFAGLPSQL